jgi:hypothetical protein
MHKKWLIPLLVAASVAVPTAAGASAHASPQAAQAASTQRQTAELFNIWVRTDHQILKVPRSAERKALATAEHKVAPCAAGIASGRRTAKGQTSKDDWTPIDFEAEYEVILAPATRSRNDQASAWASTAKLKPLLTSAESHDVLSLSHLLQRMDRFNVCADLKSWRAHHWKTSAEPSNAKFALHLGKRLMDDAHGDLSGGATFSVTQKAKLQALRKRVDARNRTDASVTKTGEKWLSKHGL